MLSINLATVHIEKILGKTMGMPGFEPGAAGCEASMLSIVLCGPPQAADDCLLIKEKGIHLNAESMVKSRTGAENRNPQPSDQLSRASQPFLDYSIRNFLLLYMLWPFKAPILGGLGGGDSLTGVTRNR